MLDQRGRQSRLANSRRAGSNTFTIDCLGPASQQHIEFFLTPNERSQTAGVTSLAAFRRTGSQYRPGVLWPCDTFQVLCTEVLKLKQIAYESSCAFRNTRHVRRSDPLQAGR